MEDSNHSLQNYELIDFANQHIQRYPLIQDINEMLSEVFQKENFEDETETHFSTGQWQVGGLITPWDITEKKYDIFFGIYNPNDFPITVTSTIGCEQIYDDVIIPPQGFSSLTNDYPILLKEHLDFHPFMFKIILPSPQKISVTLRYGKIPENYVNKMAQYTNRMITMLGFGCVRMNGGMMGRAFTDVTANEIENVLLYCKNDQNYAIYEQFFKIELNRCIFIRKVEYWQNTIK